ncbi:MAG: hypothetical protein OEV42_21585, partial [Deltaproteobacteria bacterium]|nr:hypothetical protein [Deltaproteobacteria bacterium]
IPVAEANLRNTLTVDGCYGNGTMRAIKAIINGTAETFDRTLVDTNVSHQLHKAGHGSTTARLYKEYYVTGTGFTNYHVDQAIGMEEGKIIDKELLVGISSKINNHPTADDDIGILELYQNDDWDGDGISNYIEVENSKRVVGKLINLQGLVTSHDVKELVGNENTYTGVEYTEIDEALLFDPLDSETGVLMSTEINATNRGVHYIGEILMQNSLVDNGEYSTDNRIDGFRIPNNGKGYYYSKGGDPFGDIDNYATLATISAVEKVGRLWEAAHPDLAPLRKKEYCSNGTDFTHDNKSCLDTDATKENGVLVTGGKRFGVLDFSKAGGGEFFSLRSVPIGRQTYFANGNIITTDHNTHKNGRDLDVRYVLRDDIGERRFDFDENNSAWYDAALTRELMGYFVEAGAIVFYVDADERTNIGPGKVDFLNSEGQTVSATVIEADGHDDHFHVVFPSTYEPINFDLSIPEEPNPTLDFSTNPVQVTVSGDENIKVNTKIKTNVLLDDKNWPFLKGTKFHVTATSSENSIGSLGNNDNCYWKVVRYCRVVSDGTLEFDYTAPAVISENKVVTIKVWDKPGGKLYDSVLVELIPQP